MSSWFERLTREPVPMPEDVVYRRAAGEILCACGRRYDRHPQHDDWPWVHVLCDGELVKL